MTRRFALAGLSALAGCTLVDQRTFNPGAGKPPAVAAAPLAAGAASAEPGPKPLLTIRPPIAPGSLSGDVAKAVTAARRLKPGVVFDVVELTPEGTADIGGQAAEVARLIVAQGIPPNRVRLAARPILVGAREVRVYVR